MSADEERSLVLLLEVALAYKRLERVGQIKGNRHDPFLSPFAAQKHLGSRPIELNVARVDAERFGNTRAGAPKEKQQRPITTTACGSLIRRVDKSVKLLSREVMRHFGMRLFDRDRQDALCDAD
jgi:hypothetical protein